MNRMSLLCLEIPFPLDAFAFLPISAAYLRCGRRDDAPRIPLMQMANQEHPRERLLQRGPDSLSDAELLAVLWGTTAGSGPALVLARQLLARGGTLAQVLQPGYSPASSSADATWPAPGGRGTA
jgi:hypothetical protein